MVVGNSDITEEIRDAFDVYDPDGTGTISTKELHLALHILGVERTTEEIEQMVSSVYGSLSVVVFEEFVEITRVMKRVESPGNPKWFDQPAHAQPPIDTIESFCDARANACAARTAETIGNDGDADVSTQSGENPEISTAGGEPDDVVNAADDNVDEVTVQCEHTREKGVRSGETPDNTGAGEADQDGGDEVSAIIATATSVVLVMLLI